MAFNAEKKGRTTSTRIRNYDHRSPLRYNEASFPVTADPNDPDAPNTVDPELMLHRMQRDEFYDHGGNDAMPLGAREARAALEQYRRKWIVATGFSDARCFSPGHTFNFDAQDLPGTQGEWVCTGVTHEGRVPHILRNLGTEPPGSKGSLMYSNTFECSPFRRDRDAAAIRPKRRPRRLVQVMETAVVVGPSGEEIYTDELGRVKVKFHWDRSERCDDTNSCWIRPLMSWAGTAYGVNFIPRVGMEVLVSYLGGNPDRPVIMGCLHNGVRPTIFPLPEGKTRSAIRTQSSPATGGYNEFAFEDAANQEMVYLRAQKDHREVVLNDHAQWVGHDQKVEVIGQRNDTVVRDAHYQVHGNESRSVQQDASELVVGNKTERVKGHVTSTFEQDQVVRVEGTRVDVVAMNEDRQVEKNRTDRVLQAEAREIGTSFTQVHKDALVAVGGTYTVIVGSHDAPRSFAVHTEGQTSLRSTQPTQIVSDAAVILQCGESMLRLLPDRIEISSPTVVVTAAGAKASFAEDEIKLVSTTKLVGISETTVVKSTSGGVVHLTGDVKIDGDNVKLKSSADESDESESQQTQPTTIKMAHHDGTPMAGLRYILIMGDGSEISGVLDSEGKAVLDLEEEAEVIFPDVTEPEEQ
jgi:type VI secretion system secreted protein VgrG